MASNLKRERVCKLYIFFRICRRKVIDKECIVLFVYHNGICCGYCWGVTS